MTSKCKTWLWATNIFSIIVANRELCIWSLFVAVINDTYITTAKYRAFIRVISYSELSKIKIEFFTHIQRKNEGF